VYKAVSAGIEAYTPAILPETFQIFVSLMQLVTIYLELFEYCIDKIFSPI